MDIGKGVGTFGVWMAVAVIGFQEPFSVIVAGLFGVIATIKIWE